VFQAGAYEDEWILGDMRNATATADAGGQIDTVSDRFWNLAISVYLLSGPVTILLLILARRDARPSWDTAFALSGLSSAALLLVGYWFIWPIWGNMFTGSIWCFVLGVVGVGAHAAALRFESLGSTTPPPNS
jgi:hypothetical protein